MNRSPFLGRHDAMAFLGERLGPGGLVSVLGLGGLGKTRLAWEFTEAAAAERIWVEVQAWMTTRDLLDRVASQLGVPSVGSPEALIGALDLRPRLVVLDNAEDALGAVADVIDTLRARGLRTPILVTSRQPIDRPDCTPLRLSGLDEAAGARLYEILAPDIGSEAERRGLARIVDGSPLALELAAARAHLLPPGALAARLERDLRDLAEPHGSRPDRHRALTVTLRGSWEAISPAAQRCLAQSTVFRGTFAVSDAEAVIKLPDTPLVDALEELVGASLLRARAGRLWLVPPVRIFAAGHLDDAAIQARHCAWVCARAATLAEQIDGPHAGRAVQAMEALVLDVRAAFEWGIEHTPTKAQQLAVHCCRYFRHRGPASMHRDMLARSLEAPAPALRIALRRNRAWLELERGRFDAALTWLDGWQTDVVSAAHRAWSLFALGRIDEARSTIKAALAMPAAQPRARCVALDRAARIEGMSGQLPAALAYSEEALALAEHTGLDIAIASLMNDRALLLTWGGRFADAAALFTTAIDKAAEVGDRRGRAAAQYNLGNVLRTLDQLPEARRCLEDAEDAYLDLGISRVARALRGEFALLALLEGDAQTAQLELQATARAFSSTGLSEPAARYRTFAAFALVRLGRHADAVEVCQMVRTRLPDTRPTALDRLIRCAEVCAQAMMSDSRDLRHALWLQISATRAVPTDYYLSLASAEAHRCLEEACPLGVLQLRPDGSGGVLPDGAPFDLGHRPSVHPLLRALALAQTTGAPPLSVDDLFAYGWPGESIQLRSRRDRVYQAIKMLRRAGLEALIQQTRRGYRFDPGVFVLLDAD